MSITIDNIKTWRDWGMVLTPAKDKKPLTKKGEWSADWSEDDLLKAERLAVFHQPDKRGKIGSNILTIDFDCDKFIASAFSSLFPDSFCMGKKDETGAIRTTHIEYEIDPADRPKRQIAYEKVIEVLTSTCSIIAGKDRHIISNVKPLRLSKTQLEHVLETVKAVNFMREAFLLFPEKGIQKRDKFHLRLAGALLDTDLTTERKEEIIEAFCYATNDFEEIKNRIRKIKYVEKNPEGAFSIFHLCEYVGVNNTSPLAKAFDELKPETEEDQTEDETEEIDYKRTIAFNDLNSFLTTDFPQPSYIIEPLVSDQSIVQIVGASGVGKTMFGLAIAGAVSTANGLLGMTSIGGARPVLYVEGELPASDIQIRIDGMFKAIERKCDPNMFYISSLQQQLKVNDKGFTPIQTEQGLIEIENAIVDIKKRTGKMPVVFIDNISCLASGLKENDADAWSPIINKFVKWKNMGSTVFYFHHLNKGNDSSGSTMQHRTIDMVIRMRKPDNKQKIKTFEKQGVQAIVDFPKWRLHDNSKYAVEHMLICEDWKWQKMPVLTSDEADIIKMVNDGLDVKEMSKKISLAEKTIYKKIKTLKDKGVITDGVDKQTTDRQTKEVC
jgi:KaiC/GvpD/RAD55 family RecA-like ATPase